MANMTNASIAAALPVDMSAYTLAVAMVTIVYNFLVINAFRTEKRIRTPFNMYILNMACSDASMAIFSMLFQAAYRLIDADLIPYHLCTFSEIAGKFLTLKPTFLVQSKLSITNLVMLCVQATSCFLAARTQQCWSVWIERGQFSGQISTGRVDRHA